MTPKRRSEGAPTKIPGVVLPDANVFFAPRLRDLFLHLHEAELINVHWTREIENEWTRNVLAKQHADPNAIQACLHGMRDAAEGWEVAGYEKFIEHFESVDEKDRHVAAAAYKLSLEEWPGQPVALVTKNVKDFPHAAFTGTNIICFSTADYLDALYAEEPERVLEVIEGCRKKLKAPKVTREEYVAILVKHGCDRMAQTLAKKWSVECPLKDKAGNLYYESDKLANKRKTK